VTKRRRALGEGQAELQRLGVPIEVAADLLDPQPVPNAWHDLARPGQLPPPGDWSVWLILAGRGWGKTATGAHWLAEQVQQAPGRSEWAVMAPTYRDVRDVCVEGSYGVLRV
jgi:phage terminase large subunit-like protein